MKRINAAFLAFAVACALLVTPASNAATVADGTPFNPGVALTGTSNFGGTVIANVTDNFAETITPNFTGSLRTVVVQNGGGTLDFYYQISNIASVSPPADIFRISVAGFDPFATGVMDYSTNGLAGIAGAGAFIIGNQSPRTADRDPAIGSGVAFGFAANPGLPLFDPNNLNTGDTSFFMIVRTNATAYAASTATISGFGTALADTLSPTGAMVIPLPSAAFAGLALLGGLGIRRRRRQS